MSAYASSRRRRSSSSSSQVLTLAPARTIVGAVRSEHMERRLVACTQRVYGSNPCLCSQAILLCSASIGRAENSWNAS
eukprot:3359680-Rhodomonas_salina.1